jgi:hypothetical protein
MYQGQRGLRLSTNGVGVFMGLDAAMASEARTVRRWVRSMAVNLRGWRLGWWMRARNGDDDGFWSDVPGRRKMQVDGGKFVMRFRVG